MVATNTRYGSTVLITPFPRQLVECGSVCGSQGDCGGGGWCVFVNSRCDVFDDVSVKKFVESITHAILLSFTVAPPAVLVEEGEYLFI